MASCTPLVGFVKTDTSNLLPPVSVPIGHPHSVMQHAVWPLVVPLVSQSNLRCGRLRGLSPDFEKTAARPAFCCQSPCLPSPSGPQDTSRSTPRKLSFAVWPQTPGIAILTMQSTSLPPVWPWSASEACRPRFLKWRPCHQRQRQSDPSRRAKTTCSIKSQIVDASTTHHLAKQSLVSAAMSCASSNHLFIIQLKAPTIPSCVCARWSCKQ